MGLFDFFENLRGRVRTQLKSNNPKITKRNKRGRIIRFNKNFLMPDISDKNFNNIFDEELNASKSRLLGALRSAKVVNTQGLDFLNNSGEILNRQFAQDRRELFNTALQLRSFLTEKERENRSRRFTSAIDRQQ